MRPDLENRLGKTYPDLFRHLRSDPESVPLGRGIQTETGWYGLIDRLCLRLSAELATHPDPEFCLVQVKQKFGALRVYTTPTANPRVAELIADAVAESRTVCEPCGADGAILVTHKGTMRSLCPGCRADLG